MQIAKYKTLVVLACVLTLLILAIIDYYTGYEFAFYVFYDIPIFLAAWNLGIVWGIIFALMSVVSWLFIDFLLANSNASLTAGYWNASINLISFTSIAIAVSIIKSRIERENKLNKLLHERNKELLITNRDLRAFTRRYYWSKLT
jgi:K+-sensing histidine kinase KdpD